MSILHITIPGEPTAKGRPRATAIAGKARMFTPARTVRAEDRVATFAQHAMQGREPLTGPLAMTVAVILGVPPSWSKRKQADALAGTVRPAKRPDIDNFAKLVLDGLNTIAYADDSQVVEITATKHYGRYPAVNVAVWPIAGAAA